MSNDFNFLTVLRTGGEYQEKHVEWLQRQVRMPILCLTDSKKSMKDVTSIPFKYNWPGWWSKMEMFNPRLEIRKFMYADLDTVFIDGIPENYKTLDKTVVLGDVSRVPRPVMNSGMMFLTGDEPTELWHGFKSHAEQRMQEFQKGGDQAYINLYLNKAVTWQKLFPGEVKSYKTHINGRMMSGKEKVIVFHGQPRPWDTKVAFNRWIPQLPHGQSS